MQNKTLSELQPILDQINSYYEILGKLTNDELREALHNLECRINNNPDYRISLDDVLPEVFAIVKETAKRFTEGNIEVTANNNDIYLAKHFDFVKINNNIATYFNKWDVEGEEFEWNMIHYDEQLIGGILLHRGYAVEMATGEGKTLLATLPAFLNALSHKGIYIMTVNEYLSKRDYKTTRPIYMFYGLSTSCIEDSNLHINKKHEVLIKTKAYNADITFGKTSSFVFDYLNSHLAISKESYVQQHNFAIIDEIDSILIDEANIPHIISSGDEYNNGQIYKDYIDIITELIQHKQYYKTNLTYKKSVRFTPEGKKWLEAKTGIENLYEYKYTYEISEYKKFNKEQKHEVKKNINLQNVLFQLLQALTIYELDVDYIIDNGEIRIIDSYTGRFKKTNRWGHGFHTAIEVKEKVKVKTDYDASAVISLKNYFKLYNKVSGMSGTILSVKEELLQTYNLKYASLPPHKPNIRKDLPLRIYYSSADKDKAIINYIIENHKLGRPILIGCLSIKKADSYLTALNNNGITVNMLNAKTAKIEASLVAQAGIGNTITVSTSIAGRGTDIKPSNDALLKGGLLVIGTDLFESVRIDRQLKGRTGRQGDPGTSIFFASLDDDILVNLNKNDKEELKKTINNIVNGNYDVPKIRCFFEKAQSNQENINKYIRKEIAVKDDIIAPYRNKYYTLRDTLLLAPSFTKDIIRDLLPNAYNTINDINNHTKNLYHIVSTILNRSLKNNHSKQEEFFPFTLNQQTFTILLNLNLARDSYEYFSNEYQRQIILQIYDYKWRKFIKYVMSNLDSKEVSMLDEEYNQMIKESKSLLINKLLNSSIPFELSNIDQENKRIDNKTTDTIKEIHSQMALDTLCPCKSGRKYSECHGINIHKNRNRRRR